MLLHQHFVLTAKRRGAHPAIVDTTLGVRLTYRQALVGAYAIAGKVCDLEPGFIGIMLPNSAGAALTILATLMTGRVPAMINYATGPVENCRLAQRTCGFRTIVTSRVFCERIGCPHIDGMVYLEDIRASISPAAKLLAALKAACPAAIGLAGLHRGGEDDTALVLFTSGSEETPKAVQLTHRNIWSNCQSLLAAYDLSPDDVFLANLPYFHVFGQTANLWAPLAREMTIVTVANPMDFRGTCDVVRRERVTLICGTPTLFWGYLRGSKPGDFDSCRIFLTAADRCPDSLRRTFHEKHGKILYEAYGATETSPAVSANTPGHHRPGSVGKPLPGVQVRIEGIDSGAECSAGQAGRILVKSDSVMKGYFRDPDGTARVLREGWYDTGDMGYLDEDGYLWLTGRRRRFTKVAGEMISLVRIEDALDSVLPDGVECCVIELPHEFRGSTVVAAVSQPIDEAATRASLAALLPAIALPSRFVVIRDLPRTASGKIDFRTVAERALHVLAT